MFKAVTTYDLNDVKEVFKTNPQSVNEKDENGLPPLYTAAMYGNHQAIDFLLDNGATLDIFACAYLCKNVEGETLLKDNPALVRSTTNDGRTPLHYAAEKGNSAFAEILVQYGADVNACDRVGRTPLIEAAHGGPWKEGADNKIIELLVRNHANIDIFTASAIGNTNIIGDLLKQNKNAINDMDENGCTALYHAARNNHFNAVKHLVENGADVNKPCADGQTPLYTTTLHLLSNQADPDLVKYLIANGAPYDFHTAVALGDYQRVSDSLSQDASLANLRLRGLAPADYAIHCWHHDILQLLLKSGADPNSKDSMGRSLLSKCVNNKEFRNLLVEFGAKSNDTDSAAN
ncbi:ankyrin repeat domain-containing protein [Candidatus Poribacteria bacterium]|nr:ankyrin repeat domain-containing protein [Candidatus Poribacteria bacterium]